MTTSPTCQTIDHIKVALVVILCGSLSFTCLYLITLPAMTGEHLWLVTYEFWFFAGTITFAVIGGGYYQYVYGDPYPDHGARY